MEKNWMGLTGVRAPEQDHISIFSFTIRTGAAARSKNRRQTGDAGGVSSSVTAIDVVCSHYGADKFLRRIVQLIRGLGAAEHSEIARIVFCNGSLEGSGNPVQGFVPRGRTMPAIFPDQRLGKTTFHRFKHKNTQSTLRKIVALFRAESTCLKGEWNPDRQGSSGLAAYLFT
jgi:hypothetical protein